MEALQIPRVFVEKLPHGAIKLHAFLEGRLRVVIGNNNLWKACGGLEKSFSAVKHTSLMRDKGRNKTWE
jgi:hypothetical protein